MRALEILAGDVAGNVSTFSFLRSVIVLVETAKRDKYWVLGIPPSGIKSGFSSGIKNPAVAGFGFAGNGGASNHEVHQFAGHNDAFFRRFALGVAGDVGMGKGGGNDGVVIRICCHADFCAAFAVNLHGEGDAVLL